MVIFNRQRLACAIAAAWMSAPACAQDPLELQPTTVVTAAGHEQNIAQAPASISVITREQLEAQSYTSVIDAMKNVPGVYVSGGGNQQDITIRGMGSEYTLVWWTAARFLPAARRKPTVRPVASSSWPCRRLP